MFTDHSLITFEIKREKNPAGISWKRDWRLYDKESLCRKLFLLNWNFTSDSVQAYWNELENQLIGVIDDLAPLVMFSNKEIKVSAPQYIQNKLNERKRLLRLNRTNTSISRTERIKDSYHYLPCNLLADLLTIPSMFKSYTLE